MRHGVCELCGRTHELTFHHLIPRSQHPNRWFRRTFSREDMARGLRVCRDCHAAVHRFVPSEKELGRAYNSRELLLGHPDIARFVAWVSGRETKTRFPTRGSRRRG